MDDQVKAAQVISMTGFAATQGAFEGWTWTADIRSVNGRSLDLRLRMPDVDGLENAVRKMLQAKLGRGNVTLQIKLQRDTTATTSSLNQAALADALSHLAAIEKEAAAAGVSLVPVNASEIAAMRNVVEVADNSFGENASELRAAILASIETCLADFITDREREGAALASVMHQQIDRIETLTADAAAALGDREEAQKAALKRGLERLLGAADVPDEDRLVQELALVAVKTDVTEELDRLGAHVAAARDLMAADGPVGRKLDFLMQEFNREANTLCSKAQSSALTAIGLDLKTVIDQMREQVQNIE